MHPGLQRFRPANRVLPYRCSPEEYVGRNLLKKRFRGPSEGKGVMGYRKSIDGILQHGSQDGLGVGTLGQKDVDWPDWIAPIAPELHQEHFAANEFIDLPSCIDSIITSSEFRPDVCPLFDLAGHFHVGRVICLQYTLQRHCKLIPCNDLAMFGHVSHI